MSVAEHSWYSKIQTDTKIGSQSAKQKLITLGITRNKIKYKRAVILEHKRTNHTRNPILLQDNRLKRQIISNVLCLMSLQLQSLCKANAPHVFPLQTSFLISRSWGAGFVHACLFLHADTVEHSALIIRQSSRRFRSLHTWREIIQLCFHLKIISRPAGSYYNLWWNFSIKFEWWQTN